MRGKRRVLLWGGPLHGQVLAVAQGVEEVRLPLMLEVPLSACSEPLAEPTISWAVYGASGRRAYVPGSHESLTAWTPRETV